MNRQAGNIETIFGNPFKCEHPIGQAKLVTKENDVTDKLEQWWVEYLDNPGHQYIALLKKCDTITTRDLQEIDKIEDEGNN